MSYLSKGGIYVSTFGLPTMNNTNNETDERDKWWEYNISEQFPIKSVREANGLALIEVDKPHEGYFIRTSMKNGKMNGESSIYSKDNTLLATLTFVDGIASGPCTIYKNGILFYKGYFVNGYREGRGQEYDENGKVVYDGLFKKGKKQIIVPSNEMGYPRSDENEEFGKDGYINAWEDKFRGDTNNTKKVRLCRILREHRKVSLIVAVVSVILLSVCFILIYLNNGPYGIGSEQESYIAESGSSRYLLKFKLSNYPNLKRIEIGDDCFENVKTFQIDGLNRLESLKIGQNSFTKKKKSYGSDKSKSFHILNCESLGSIQIGQSSFSDYAGDFELKNLPLLQSIQIGIIGSNSYNFYSSSLVIRGIEMILNIVMIRSSKSTIHNNR